MPSLRPGSEQSGRTPGKSTLGYFVVAQLVRLFRELIRVRLLAVDEFLVKLFVRVTLSPPCYQSGKGERNDRDDEDGEEDTEEGGHGGFNWN